MLGYNYQATKMLVFVPPAASLEPPEDRKTAVFILFSLFLFVLGCNFFLHMKVRSVVEDIFLRI